MALLAVLGIFGWQTIAMPLPAGALARVGDVVLYPEDLEAHLGEPAAFESVGHARRVVDRFVGHELLRLAAQARGESVEGLLERLVAERGLLESVGEDEVRARYDRDRSLYERDREIRIAYAGVPIVSAGKPAASDRIERRRLADQIRLRARLHPARDELALWIPRNESRAYALESGPWSCDSDEPQGGEESTQPRPPSALIEAACGLREGRVTSVIETDDGFYVAKVRHRSRAFRIPYAKVARDIRQDLERERLDAARRAESQRLRRRARVDTSFEAIASLVVPRKSAVDLASDPAPPDAPPSPPGFPEEY